MQMNQSYMNFIGMKYIKNIIISILMQGTGISNTFGHVTLKICRVCTIIVEHTTWQFKHKEFVDLKELAE